MTEVTRGEGSTSAHRVQSIAAGRAWQKEWEAAGPWQPVKPREPLLSSLLQSETWAPDAVTLIRAGLLTLFNLAIQILPTHTPRASQESLGGVPVGLSPWPLESLGTCH